MSLIKRTTDNWLPAMFDDMFNTDWSTNNASHSAIGTHVPAVNVKENSDAFSVEVAAPGKAKEDFNLELNHNVLTISSETKEERNSENESEKFTRREYSYRSFKRSFTLPESVDSTKISANYENGILTVNLPKRDEAKVNPKRVIAIN